MIRRNREGRKSALEGRNGSEIALPSPAESSEIRQGTEKKRKRE